MPAWSDSLRQARRAAGLSRRDLAERARASEDAIYSYEHGLRHPRLESLRRLTRALGLGPQETEEILAAAGYLEESLSSELRELLRRRPPPDSLAAAVRDHTWPCFVLNERFEFTAWNTPAVRVAERDFATLGLRERNLMRFAADPRFRQQLQNWDAVVGHFMDLLAGEASNRPDGDAFNAHLMSVANEILVESPTVFNELMGLWMRATRRPNQRNIYYPHWKTSDGAELRFNTVVTTWSDFDALYANDWHPADAATWTWLGARSIEGASVLSAATVGDADAQLTWFLRLRRAREQARLTRLALAERTRTKPGAAGIPAAMIENMERGRLKPRADLILEIARALGLDGATTNLILTAAGLEAEPSDWALFLAGEQPRITWHPRNPGVRPTPLAVMQAQIADHPWPCLLVGAGCALVGGNEPLARLLGATWRAGRPRPRERTLVAFLLSPSVREHVVNWEELAAALVPSSLRRAWREQRASPRLQSLLDDLQRRDPNLLAQLQSLWELPAPVLTSRVTVPLAWRHTDGPLLSFNLVLARWNGDRPGPCWVLDWHPADAATWSWLTAQT